MLKENSKMEQRYDAVLMVIRDGFSVTEEARRVRGAARALLLCQYVVAVRGFAPSTGLQRAEFLPRLLYSIPRDKMGSGTLRRS